MRTGRLSANQERDIDESHKEHSEVDDEDCDCDIERRSPLGLHLAVSVPRTAVTWKCVTIARFEATTSVPVRNTSQADSATAAVSRCTLATTVSSWRNHRKSSPRRGNPAIMQFSARNREHQGVATCLLEVCTKSC
ncbi:hypothetical protein MRX96_036170 [Rhipicephalus microplus]